MSTDPVKSETQYQLGVPAVDGIAIPAGGNNTSNAKQGHKCCGGCCDTKRAVIVVNIINIGVILMAVFSILATRSMSQQTDAVYDDDEVQAALAAFSEAPIGIFLAVSGVKACISLAGIMGAIKYNVVLTGIAAAAFCFDAVVALIAFNVVGVVYAALFAYPHFFFIKEVRNGTMSVENYPNEVHSCCCV
mmetsp:Transcript_7748/g.12827  ORF Transcript_7748/g.12827 Transcript_7748/m.12827 type:complete len:190 (+) Transcript_7748:93-662(+)|eukprot:CAMPEP_0119003190 /NCGR_PEP_ID=MMETSP1176-20130426/407_1 /TAXON_ID=265551 /ORGANISM="Synedropsis recta cf, Strain CCMP1620" /LENGTH=189 /DNA_ID=CAMNT_0006954765 /DNA_START=86 /DNA_END=655 /DNA_ORIENTATION=-